MKLNHLVCAASCLVTVLTGCHQQEASGVNFDAVQTDIVASLDSSIYYLDKSKQTKDKGELLTNFQRARDFFKHAEPFAQYLNADNVHKVNGPPLPVHREDNGKILEPISFQALDEQLAEAGQVDRILLEYRLSTLTGYLANLKKTAAQTDINPKRFFVPMHLQLLRIFALSTISFDTPGSVAGLRDAERGLSSFEQVYNLAIGDTVATIAPGLHNEFLTELDKARSYLRRNDDFEHFNRYEFGRKHINKLTGLWVKIRKTTGLFEDPGIYAVNLDAPTFFEKNSFNPSHFRSSINRNPTKEQIKIGRKLFFDNALSADASLSCGSCHDPDKAYQDGLALGKDKDGRPLQRNTPTLINSIFQKKFFWDGRSDNLEQQINVVFDNEREFDRSGHSISMDILEDADYVEMLRQAYPGKEPGKSTIISALAAYTSMLFGFDSRFDRNMRNETSDFTDQEIRGMNLFMGKAQCATCHFIPLTNGSVPPTFSETEKEILGTPEDAFNRTLDDDLGFYWVYQEEIHRYMFKTPTIRNIEETSPYMHNGIYNTLEEVMDFYNRGGGVGMGFEVPHQTLPFDSLSLDTEEIESIIAFMKTFSDTNVDLGNYDSETSVTAMK